jgi:DNA-binding transcriptional LysR family regulator
MSAAAARTCTWPVNASLSVKWLIPRLARFEAAHPEIRLHLSELASHATSHRGAQAVVRITPTSRLSEAGVTPFIFNALGPVMSPDLAARSDPLIAPRLAAQSHPEGWPVWAALAGVELPQAVERPFAHVHFAMDAALAGLGAAIVSWPLVADDVAAGRLVAPMGFRKSESGFAIHVAPWRREQASGPLPRLAGRRGREDAALAGAAQRPLNFNATR